MHKAVQDLKIFHLGGDEISNVWKGSPECLNFIERNKHESLTHLPKSIEELGEYFLRKSAEIVYKIDDSIDLGLWEDGAIGDVGPYNKDELFSTLFQRSFSKSTHLTLQCFLVGVLSF